MLPSELRETKLIILSTMITLTVFSNFCSIMAITRRRRKISRMYYFLLHLSVADSLTAVLTLAPELISTLTEPHFYGGEVVCRTVKFLQMFAPYLSSFILVVMALDRFQTICFPLAYRTWKPANSHKRITLAWIVALSFCIPQTLVFGGRIDPESGAFMCTLQLGQPEGWKARLYVSWFCFSSFFLPLSAMTFFYARICTDIRRNVNSKNRQNQQLNSEATMNLESSASPRLLPNQPGNRPSVLRRCSSFSLVNSGASSGIFFTDKSGDSEFRPRTHSVEGISRAKIRSVKQTVVIILSYVFCSALAVGFQLWSVWINKQDNISTSLEWFFWLVTWNSILNPWIYILLNRDLQKSLGHFWCPCLQGQSRRHRFSLELPFVTSTNATPNSSMHLQHQGQTKNQGLVRPRSFTVTLDARSYSGSTAADVANSQSVGLGSNLKRPLSVVQEERSGLSHNGVQLI